MSKPKGKIIQGVTVHLDKKIVFKKIIKINLIKRTDYEKII